MKTIHINDEKELAELAKNFAIGLKGDEVITLVGELGAGKTTFAKYLIQSLIINQEVTSPTFPLVNQYSDHDYLIYHYDLYRIKKDEELEAIGFNDSIGKGILVVEWPEIAIKYLPTKFIIIKIENLGESKRLVKIKEND